MGENKRTKELRKEKRETHFIKEERIETKMKMQEREG